MAATTDRGPADEEPNMAVAVKVDVPGGTQQQYEQIAATVFPQGRLDCDDASTHAPALGNVDVVYPVAPVEARLRWASVGVSGPR